MLVCRWDIPGLASLLCHHSWLVCVPPAAADCLAAGADFCVRAGDGRAGVPGREQQEEAGACGSWRGSGCGYCLGCMCKERPLSSQKAAMSCTYS